jgi:UDP-N-acetylglucosamine acyltransferase
MVSGMSGVLSDVAPFTKVFGVPVNYIGINVIGLRRRGFSREQIDNIHEIYRAIYQQGRNISQALEYVQTYLDPTPEMGQIISFIKASKRGIVKNAIGQITSVES